MTVESFTVEYDGPALRLHRMDVKALAPSLLALADVFMLANEELGGGYTSPPSLMIDATRPGSFDVELILRTVDIAGDLLTSEGVSAAANATALGTVVVSVLKWMKNRARKGREVSTTAVEPGQVSVTWPDGTKLTAPSDCARLIENMDFTRTLRGFLEPLDGDHIDKVEIEPGPRSSMPGVTMRPKDLNGFDLPELDDVQLESSEREVILDLVTVGLRDDHKWRVSDGSTPFWVSLHDLDFIMSMEAGNVTFGRHDRLRCVLRETQFQRPSGGLRLERVVVKVIDLIVAPRQGNLPFDE